MLGRGDGDCRRNKGIGDGDCRRYVGNGDGDCRRVDIVGEGDLLRKDCAKGSDDVEGPTHRSEEGALEFSSEDRLPDGEFPDMRSLWRFSGTFPPRGGESARTSGGTSPTA